MTGNRLTDPDGKPVELEVLVQKRDDERLAYLGDACWRGSASRSMYAWSIAASINAGCKTSISTSSYIIIMPRSHPVMSKPIIGSSAAADTPGSRNYAGIKDPGIDAAVKALTQAVSPDDFRTAARALDRALMAGHYFVPLFHNPDQWVAHWHYVEHPFEHAAYGARLETWWLNQEN